MIFRKFIFSIYFLRLFFTFLRRFNIFFVTRIASDVDLLHKMTIRNKYTYFVKLQKMIIIPIESLCLIIIVP